MPCLCGPIQPDIIIGYDIFGFVAAVITKLGHPRAKLVYHNLDLTPLQGVGLFTKIMKRVEHIGARHSDIVIVSSQGRVGLLSHEAQLKTDPLIVMNCQRLAAPLYRAGELENKLNQYGARFDRLVVHLGSLGTGYGLKPTIRSMCRWKGNWGLVLAGIVSDTFLAELQTLIASLGLNERVIILPDVSFDLWYDCLFSADLGLALYETNSGNANFDFMAGAGNKLNLYLKAGIPSIVSTTPDFATFIDRFHAGESADLTDCGTIASAINEVFSSDERYETYCRNARHAFQTEYNFEKQFSQVLNQL